MITTTEGSYRVLQAKYRQQAQQSDIMSIIDTTDTSLLKLDDQDSPKSSAQVLPTEQVQSSAAKPSSWPSGSTSTASTTAQESIIEITKDDVLFGRGGGTNRHPGNIYFRDLVSEQQPAYVQARKSDKTLIAKSIVAKIRESQGRFLKVISKGVYEDVNDKKAAEKTSQALREGLCERMREIISVGGVGVQQLKKVGVELYVDDGDEVRRKVQKYQAMQMNGGEDGNVSGTESEEDGKPAGKLTRL